MLLIQTCSAVRTRPGPAPKTHIPPTQLGRRPQLLSIPTPANPDMLLHRINKYAFRINNPSNARTHTVPPAQTSTHATKWPPNRGPHKQVFVCGVAERSGPVRQDKHHKVSFPTWSPP